MSRVMSRASLAVVLALCLAVGACGKKGGLEPPPGATGADEAAGAPRAEKDAPAPAPKRWKIF